MSDPNNEPGQGGYGQGGFGPNPGQGSPGQGDFGQGSQGYGAGGGYGAQPPGQYGPPPGQYGGPGQYGPPPGQYGPPPGQYGPPPGQYGAPGQYGPGGYGFMPPAQLPPPVTAADAPPPVRQAVLIMFIQAGIGVLAIIITLVTLHSVRQTIRNSNPDYDSAKIDSLVNAIVVASIVFGIIFLVLYVLLALQVRKGKNWARIVTWVLAGISLLTGLVSLGGNASGLSKSVGVVQLLLDVAIIVLLVRGGSFFAKRRPN